MLITALTERLGLRVPLIAAPLGRGSSPRFLQSIADAGALGFVGLLHMDEGRLHDELAEIVDATGGRVGVNATLIKDQRRRVRAALDVGVRVVSLWQGDPAPYIPMIKDAGGTVFWTVGDPSDAVRAADLGVDFLVCQGSEAGGHVVSTVSTMSLLPAIVDSAADVPVIAAGGIADGRGLAAVLALGAAGAWMGTRFVASVESANHPGYKDLLVQASAPDSVETRLFDGGWPNSPHRVLRNSTHERWHAAGDPAVGSRPGEGEQIGTFPNGRPIRRYDVSAPWESMEGEWEAMPLYAGSSVQLVDRVEPVRQIISRIAQSAELELSRAYGLIS